MATATGPLVTPLRSTPSLARVYGKEIRYELIKLARNRAFTLSTTGFPVIFYLMFASMNAHDQYHGQLYPRYLLAGYACFGAMGSALFGIGAGLAHERGHGWLELKRASPMPAGAYLLAKLVASICFAIVIAILLATLGTMISGHIISLYELGKLLLVVVGGVVPFASMGLLLGLLMAPNAAPGVINLFYLPLSFCGGLWMPIEVLPHWLQQAAPFSTVLLFLAPGARQPWLQHHFAAAVLERAGGLHGDAARALRVCLSSQRGSCLIERYV